MSTAEEKVPGGKLVRVAVRPDGRVEISGDFFLHPEESITLIEDTIGRLGRTEPAEKVEELLKNLIAETNIELIGIDVPVIVRLYQRCLNCGE
jgi:hypothetical protein